MNDYCCSEMKLFTDDPRVQIIYSPRVREYYIPLKFQNAVQTIYYCPWCGKKLPAGLDEKFDEVLKEEYKIDSTNSFFSDSNQYDERKPVTFGRTQCPCGFESKRAACCIDHIIEEHYSCPWCEDLTFLDKHAWKNLPQDELALRSEHIAACARIIRTNLWRCLQCYGIFHIRRLSHKCGGRCLVNIGRPSDCAVKNVEEYEQLRTCCLCKKVYVKVQSCETHLLRKHGQCPFCKVFINKTGLILTNLSEQEKKVIFDHLIACAQEHDRFIWACEQCLGASTMKTGAHLSSLCKEPLTLVGQKFYPKNHLLNNNNNNNNDEIDDDQERVDAPSTVQKCVQEVDGVKTENNNQNHVLEEDIMEILSQYSNEKEDIFGYFDGDGDITKYFFEP